MRKMEVANHASASRQPFEAAYDSVSAFGNIPDPDPAWAKRNPDRALALLYVSPRPCEALDRLLNI
jgi:hypothetical protein